MSPREPRLATWILEHCVSEYRGDSFLGDLIEQYPERGIWWYWRQALDAMRARAIRTVVAATETEGSVADSLEDQISWIVLNGYGCLQGAVFTGMLLRNTCFARSGLAMAIGVALTVGAVNCAAGAAHVLRMRVAR